LLPFSCAPLGRSMQSVPNARRTAESDLLIINGKCQSEPRSCDCTLQDCHKIRGSDKTWEVFRNRISSASLFTDRRDTRALSRTIRQNPANRRGGVSESERCTPMEVTGIAIQTHIHGICSTAMGSLEFTGEVSGPSPQQFGHPMISGLRHASSPLTAEKCKPCIHGSTMPIKYLRTAMRLQISISELARA
jgi:hypothetical protein